jgi:hypothetical protein
MAVERFETGKVFFWLGDKHQVMRILGKGKVNTLNLETGETRTTHYSELVKALMDGELWFSGSGRTETKAVRDGYVDLSDCPDWLRELAEYRLEVITPILGLPRGKRRRAILERVAEYKAKHAGKPSSPMTAISKTSVYRWSSDYEQSGEDLSALIYDSEKRGGHGHRLQDKADDILRRAITDLCGGDLVRTVKFVHREVRLRIKEANVRRLEADQLTPPSRATVARRMREMRLSGQITSRLPVAAGGARRNGFHAHGHCRDRR